MKNIIIAAGVFMLSGCATVYTDESFSEYQNDHKTVAVLPFYVMLDIGEFPPGTDRAVIEDQKHDEAILFQQQLYTQFLNGYEKGEYTVSFQDVDKTNVILQNNNMQAGELNKFTKSEVGKALGVDAVIYGTLRYSGVVMASTDFATALFGGTEKSNVRTVMTVYDTDSGKLIWSFDDNRTSGIFYAKDSLATSLLKKSSDKFPYKVAE